MRWSTMLGCRLELQPFVLFPRSDSRLNGFGRAKPAKPRHTRSKNALAWTGHQTMAWQTPTTSRQPGAIPNHSVEAWCLAVGPISPAGFRTLVCSICIHGLRRSTVKYGGRP